MGLFGFVQDIGRKVFNTDADAAEKIQEHILANNPGVENLQVTYEDGIVSLAGDCTNKQAFQKCVLMAGNVEGVKDVYATDLRPYVDPTPRAVPVEAEEEYYVIQSGDSLSKIAKQFYGDANKWMDLFEANKEIILDPDKIFPGQKIVIPRK
jgi:nucleoid-associated protein YgaU